MIVSRTVLWSICLLAASAFVSVHAQKTFSISRFTTDNGLPSNGIKGIDWDDETGFCWIATEAGVTRYNGSDFVLFSKSNTPGLFSERMLCMSRTRQGRIVTIDESGNIFFVMQNKLQYMGSVSIDTRPSTFKLIGIFGSSSLFRQTSGHPPPLFGFNFVTETLIPLSADRILFQHVDSVYNFRPGLYELRLGKVEPGLLAPLRDRSRIFASGQTILSFEPARGFSRFDPSWLPIAVPCSGLPEKALSAGKLFWQQGGAHPVFISGRQAWMLEFSGSRIVATMICDTVPQEDLISFAVYNEMKSTLVLGTDSRGIIVISENLVRSVKLTQTGVQTGMRKTGPVQAGTGTMGRMSPASRAMRRAQARAGIVSAGRTASTYSQVRLGNGGILTSQGDVFGGPPEGASPLPIHTVFNNFVFTSPDSLLWFSHGDSIGAWSYRSLRTTYLFAGKGSITDGFAITGNRLYVANAIGIGEISSGKIQYHYTYPQRDINSNVPFSMVEWHPDTLAIASCNGLFLFDTRSNRIDTLLCQPGLCVRALWKYKDYLFIGTYGKGIYIWRNGVLKSIPLDRDKYLSYAHCFQPDRLGYCWISSNKGLFRARPADMISAFENGDQEIYYHYYGRNDGMAITELNGGCTPCALQLNDSILSFPSMDGLVWVDPSKPLTRLPEGGIYIDGFTADSHRINTASLVHPDLPSDTREIEFHPGFPAWVNKENIYLDYRLTPWQKDWQQMDVRKDPDLRFSNLPPGDYSFQLRKLDGFGNQHFSYVKTTFRILAPWYQRPWVWILFGCCIAALIAGIVRLRTHQLQRRQNRLQKQIAEKTRELKQKNEELEKSDITKTRLISIISHDLITPLKFLHLAGKNLVEKKSKLSEELQIETITEIMNTSKELELLSTNILNWIKYRNEDRRLVKENFLLHQLINQLFGILGPMAKHKQIRLINQVDETTSLFQYIEPVRIILYNLILNGINFTTHGFILVSSVFTSAGISLTVRDTGVGMTQEQINNVMADHFIISSTNVDQRKGNGLGYLIIKDLLKISRGSLSIESEKDHGTQVIVLLPVH